MTTPNNLRIKILRDLKISDTILIFWYNIGDVVRSIVGEWVEHVSAHEVCDLILDVANEIFRVSGIRFMIQAGHNYPFFGLDIWLIQKPSSTPLICESANQNILEFVK